MFRRVCFVCSLFDLCDYIDGELYSWGANGYGQLGLGSVSDKVLTPTLVKSLAGIPIAFITCGANHSFAISRYNDVRTPIALLYVSNEPIDNIYLSKLQVRCRLWMGQEFVRSTRSER